MNRLQLLLGKLASQSGEVTKQSIKCQQFGFDDDWGGINNRDHLNDDINDLNALVQMLNVEFDLQYKPDEYSRSVKVEKVNRWASYASEYGFVET